MGSGQPRHEHPLQDHRAAPRSLEAPDSHTGPGPVEGVRRAEKLCPPWEDMEGLKGENLRGHEDQKPVSQDPQ